MHFGVAVVTPGLPEDDHDYYVQPLHHNLTHQQLKQAVAGMEAELDRARIPATVKLKTFTHALDHTESDARLCKGCFAALQQLYDDSSPKEEPSVLSEAGPPAPPFAADSTPAPAPFRPLGVGQGASQLSTGR